MVACRPLRSMDGALLFVDHGADCWLAPWHCRGEMLTFRSHCWAGAEAGASRREWSADGAAVARLLTQSSRS